VTDGGEPDLVHSERDVLQRYLDKMRDAVVAATEELTDAQLRTPGVPSGTNLLGLVHHLTGVERHWFPVVFLGEDVECDMSMQAPLSSTRSDVLGAYRDECDRSDRVIRGCADLSRLSARPNPGEDGLDSLRLIVAHMVEETGRHAGHADILRELIDGRTNG
jgi:uncharacterized damage-inducible protein DinB